MRVWAAFFMLILVGFSGCNFIPDRPLESDPLTAEDPQSPPDLIDIPSEYLEIVGPWYVRPGNCVGPIEVHYLDPNYQSIVAIQNLDFSLIQSSSLPSFDTFSDSGCTQSLNSFRINAGQSQTRFWVKTIDAVSMGQFGFLDVVLSTNLPTRRTFSLRVLPTAFAQMTTPNLVSAVNACIPITVNLVDPLNNPRPASNFELNYWGHSTDMGALFSDAACLSPLAPSVYFAADPGITIAEGVSSFTFYMKNPIIGSRRLVLSGVSVSGDALGYDFDITNHSSLLMISR